MNEIEAKKLLGQNIRALRNSKGLLTQFELGENVNINQRQIALIETGKSFPSLKTLINFTEIFKCSLADLFRFDLLNERELLKNELTLLMKDSSTLKLQLLCKLAQIVNIDS